MSLPAIFFGMILATIYGSAYHLLRGGGLGRLIFDLLLAWAGFWLGQVLADLFGFHLFRVGQINMAAASIICLLFLIAGNWLRLPGGNDRKR